MRLDLEISAISIFVLFLLLLAECHLKGFSPLLSLRPSNADMLMLLPWLLLAFDGYLAFLAAA
jgi:hypothetical protein